MLEAPQLVNDSRMLYFTRVPADPGAATELRLAENNQCFINQHVLDSDDQSSGFERHSHLRRGRPVGPRHPPGRRPRALVDVLLQLQCRLALPSGLDVLVPCHLRELPP